MVFLSDEELGFGFYPLVGGKGDVDSFFFVCNCKFSVFPNFFRTSLGVIQCLFYIGAHDFDGVVAKVIMDGGEDYLFYIRAGMGADMPDGAANMFGRVCARGDFHFCENGLAGIM